MKFKLKSLLVVIFALYITDSTAEKYIIGAQNIEYFPHYDFTSLVDKGAGWAVLEAFSKSSGHEFVYVHMPVRRLQLELLKGHVDFVYPDNPRWNNEVIKSHDKHFSLPIAHTLSGTVIRPDDIGKGVDFVKRLAIPKGFTPAKWRDRIEGNLVEIIPVDETYNALFLLQHKKVDALDLEYHVTDYFTHRYPQLGPFSVDVRLPYIDVPFLLSTLRHPEIINELNVFIENNQPLITEIYAKYHITLPNSLIEKFRQEQGVAKEDLWKPL